MADQKSWDEYFMNIVVETAKRSKDPSTKVGCVIVNENRRIISTGYNGFPAGCDENVLSWQRPEKYNYVVHAEMNALIFADRRDLINSTIYVDFSPCENCLKHILQAGVKNLVYKSIYVNKHMQEQGLLKNYYNPIMKMIKSMPDFHSRNINTGKSIIEDIEEILK